MVATYFQRHHEGHSFRGQDARDRGAMAWSRLPHRLRRGLKSADAEKLSISQEWHHAGKYATEVYVYLPAAVEAFWAVLDEAGVTAADALDVRTTFVFRPLDEREALEPVLCVCREAARVAEAVRSQWEEGR